MQITVAAQSSVQASRPTLTPIVRPTLTPIVRPTLTPPPAVPSPPAVTPDASSNQQSADIRWSQVLSDVQHLQQVTLFSISVRGENRGSASGDSAAILHYDPATLRLLDVTAFRATDWVRAHDVFAGQITLVLGNVVPGEQIGMRARFVILQPTDTTIRLIRDDAKDRGNPLFLNLRDVSIEPIKLMLQENASTITMLGRGYKPGERLVLWANTGQESVIAIEETFTAMNDEDGSVDLRLPLPEPDVISIVVRGDISGVIGVAKVESQAGE